VTSSGSSFVNFETL